MSTFISLLSEIWWQLLIVIGLWFGILFYFRANPKGVVRRLEKDSIRVDAEPPVYLKKTKWTNEWRTIYPIVKLETIPTKENGEFDFDADWSNVKYDKLRFFFGSKGMAIKTIIMVAIVFLAIFGIYEIISSYNQIISNPLVQSCIQNAGIQIR